ncbi:MAG: BppU family phage baseplate upper protein [Staphylococcus xylosus]|uniref:BppU family phage baseplate upper protein n=1 Tax=Staphylococcus xylosus TaxID=1288 RepID=UPI0008534C9F|nr:BppU family phage baseplate upper protein [Staphylococcus xylosus]OEK87188.1 hypothetical protein AST14_04995 [Staphylococcus xylosus]
MTNGIDKKALFKLKAEPYLKPISDLGVGFYNLDENTAILRFQLSNTKGPLLIHKNNLMAYAYFESSNGSVSDVIELEVEDSNKGLVTITLDKEFLQASTSTKVKGQVYVGVNNVDNKSEYNEVAVFREFNFEVKDALINKISAFTKIEYIRMFDQLKTRIKQRVLDIEEAIANGDDYVTEMKSVLQKGTETLNQIVSDGKQAIQSYIAESEKDIDLTQTEAVDEINKLSKDTKESVDSKANKAVETIETTSSEATAYVDDKMSEFNQTVENNNLITTEDLDQNISELTWQKHKITSDDGTIKIVDLEYDIENLNEMIETGFFYTTNTPNLPTDVSSAGFLTVYARKGNTPIKHVYQPYSQNKIVVRHYYNEWSEWQKVSQTHSDTGWVPFKIINGGRTNTAYGYGDTRNGYGCSYRTVTNGDVTTKYIRFNADTVVHKQVIAQLPSNFAKSPQVGFIRAPLVHNGTSVIVENDGSVKLYVANESEWEASDDKYIYGTISWIE